MEISRAVVGAAVVAMLAAGCSRQPDLEANVRKSLDDAELQGVGVDVDDGVNIVHLKGSVGSIADRTKAAEIAEAVVGTSGDVLNELTVRGLNDETAGAFDRDISKALARMVDKDTVLASRDLDFEVANGMVTIRGDVRSAEEKRRVEQIARAAPGVKDVANGLQITADK
jgi:osmotically-inducible protein OsmY